MQDVSVSGFLTFMLIMFLMKEINKCWEIAFR